jgi:hypothetical protein
MWRSFTLLWLAAMMSGSLGTDRLARAQDEDERPAPAPARVHVGAGWVASDHLINVLVFASDGDADSARRITESRLKSRINDIDHLCGLGADQRKKLDLAGRGDIKRFFDRIAEKRNLFRLGEERQADELMQARLELGNMGHQYRASLFDERSMFGKVLGTILDREQARRFRSRRSDDRLSLHQSRVQWVAQTLQKNLSLDDGQRLGLLCVLLEETRPPRRFGPSDYYGIMYQAARIPERKLRPIFAEAEWTRLRREFDDAKRQEQVLKDFGYLPDENDRPDGNASRRAPKPVEKSG